MITEKKAQPLHWRVSITVFHKTCAGLCSDTSSHLPCSGTRIPGVLAVVASRPASSPRHRSPPAQRGILPGNPRSSPKQQSKLPAGAGANCQNPWGWWACPDTWHSTLANCFSQAPPKHLCNKIVPNSRLRLYFWKRCDTTSSLWCCCSAPLRWGAQLAPRAPCCKESGDLPGTIPTAGRWVPGKPIFPVPNTVPVSKQILAFGPGVPADTGADEQCEHQTLSVRDLPGHLCGLWPWLFRGQAPSLQNTWNNKWVASRLIAPAAQMQELGVWGCKTRWSNVEPNLVQSAPQLCAESEAGAQGKRHCPPSQSPKPGRCRCFTPRGLGPNRPHSPGALQGLRSISAPTGLVEASAWTQRPVPLHRPPRPTQQLVKSKRPRLWLTSALNLYQEPLWLLIRPD